MTKHKSLKRRANRVKQRRRENAFVAGVNKGSKMEINSKKFLTGSLEGGNEKMDLMIEKALYSRK